MNSWIPKKNIVRVTMIIAGLITLAYFVCLLVLFNKAREINTAHQDINSDSFKQEKFEAIKNIISNNTDSIQNVENFFVKKGDEVKFIEQIESLAGKFDLNFEMSSIEANIDPGNLKEDIEMNIKISGSWSNVMKFINNLKKMPFGVSISQVNLDAERIGSWSGSLKAIVFREK